MDFLIPLLNVLVLALALIVALVGLVMAPWPVLLVLLIIVLVVSQRMMDQTLHPLVHPSGHSPAVSSTTPSDGDRPSSQQGNSSLHFRGASYTPDATPRHAPLTGKYRGKPWTSSQS